MSTGPVPFGHLDGTVALVNKDYINERPVLSSPFFDPLDDMFGALGSFFFRVAVEGVITPVKPSGYEIAINRVGVYVQDKYDYEGDQVLGFWKFDDGGNVSKIPLWNYHEVSNGSFRDYRAARQHGGDFWVFSDIKILNLHPLEKFTAKI